LFQNLDSVNKIILFQFFITIINFVSVEMVRIIYQIIIKSFRWMLGWLWKIKILYVLHIEVLPV